MKIIFIHLCIIYYITLHTPKSVIIETNILNKIKYFPGNRNTKNIGTHPARTHTADTRPPSAPVHILVHSLKTSNESVW